MKRIKLIDVLLILSVSIFVFVFAWTRTNTLLYINGNSMAPTFRDTNKVVLTKEKVIEHDQVVALKSPKSWGSKGANYVKRIKGMPGDTVKIVNDKLYINEMYLRNNIGCNMPDLEYTLLDGEYFILGDNEKRSNDSLSQYCKNKNAEFIIYENSIIAHGNIKHIF